MGLTLGENRTEQFTVQTKVQGKQIAFKEIHDPFVSTTIKLKGWRHAWNALLHGITVNVNVNGTHGAIRAVMALDPRQLQQDTEIFLRDLARRRIENDAKGVCGFYAETEPEPATPHGRN